MCRDGVSGNNNGLAAGAAGHPQAATPNMVAASRDYAMVSRRFITTTSGNDVRPVRLTFIRFLELKTF